MKTENEMQWMANGIILACSTFITDRTVDKESVISVLSQAGITKDEWDKCEDGISKQNIFEYLDNELIYTYPNHICNNNVDENGMTKTRKMILKS